MKTVDEREAEAESSPWVRRGRDPNLAERNGSPLCNVPLLSAPLPRAFPAHVDVIFL